MSIKHDRPKLKQNLAVKSKTPKNKTKFIEFTSEEERPQKIKTITKDKVTIFMDKSCNETSSESEKLLSKKRCITKNNNSTNIKESVPQESKIKPQVASKVNSNKSRMISPVDKNLKSEQNKTNQNNLYNNFKPASQLLNGDSDSEMIIVKKPKNKKRDKNNTKLSQTHAINDNNLHNKLKNTLEIDIDNLDAVYDFIPTGKLEDISYLKQCYQQLFERETEVVFRVYELNIENSCPAPSNHKKGKIDNYNDDTKMFLIELDNSEVNTNLLQTYSDNESNFISVGLKDFIELWVKKLATTDCQNFQEKIETNSNPVFSSSTIYSSEVETVASNNNLQNTNDSKNSTSDGKAKKSQVNLFNRILIPQIRKQVEYYFSDKNYYTDMFLLEQAKLNSDNCKISI